MKKILVIQTAFIGDVVLATALIENLHQQWPEAKMDILVRKGNESLFESHPFLNQVLVWDKKNNKYHHWVGLLFKIRSNHYDVVINAQRFAATGAWTALSGAKIKIGFDKNPFSFLFTNSVVHQFSEKGQHEIDRNHQLLSCLFEAKVAMPKLYPTTSDELAVINYQQAPYLCIAPASVWFTKQFSSEKWVDLINALPFKGPIYLIGGPGDKLLCDQILQKINRKSVVNLAGRLSFLASAALQKKSVLNYVNDSAPMHFASAVNAPVVAVYCSTLPDFGFGPLSDHSFIVQTNEGLTCRPCGIHGKKQCPLKHFDCAKTIKMDQLIAPLLQVEQH
ncbi:MAG: glycosyltransferase family 9 protein [Chitinophagia bacterium]|jgi:heptosyltransferase-2|nr:glycosyltransferase family 9 protein [Chitinophagia bacterium]